MKARNCLPTLMVPSDAIKLYDNELWRLRFEIRSESSARTYVISQHKQGRYWGCSCPGWKTRRRCKHLERFGLPNDSQPYEVSDVCRVGEMEVQAQMRTQAEAAPDGRFITWDSKDV